MKREADRTLVSKIDGYMYRLFIEQDKGAGSPRKDFDGAGRIITWSRDYRSPDEREYIEPIGNQYCTIQDSWGVLSPERISQKRLAEDKTGWLEIVNSLQEYRGAYIILPLCHGGDGLSETNGYTDGYAYISRETILKEWGKSGAKLVTKTMREKALACLRAEIKEYNLWANGEVYGCVIDRIAPDACGDFDESHEEGEEVDDCWGIYGYEHAEKEGLDSIRYCVNGPIATENAQNNSAMPYKQAEAHGQLTISLH